MVRVLSAADVADLLSLPDLLPVVAEAFRKQGAGEVERPDRPHFPVGIGLDADPGGPAGPDGNETVPAGPDGAPAGTALVMPAYVHGREYYATKLVGVHEGNAEQGLPTVNAQVVLSRAATGLPAALLDGTDLTNARTGCIGGLAARELATEPVTLGVIGAGTQARWQARAIAAATDLRAVRVYSPSDSKFDCAADLRATLDADVAAVDSPREAVAGANVVVTATTATEPVFPGDALGPGTLVVAVGAYTPEMRELDDETIDRAARVFADVPEEAAAVGDVADADGAVDLVPFADVVAGAAGRGAPEDILVVESVGTAVLDAAAAEHVFERAVASDVGTVVPLSPADRGSREGRE